MNDIDPYIKQTIDCIFVFYTLKFCSCYDDFIDSQKAH